MHKDYNKTKKGKLEKQKKAYQAHAMKVFNGADNYAIIESSENPVVAERIDDGVKLTLIQEFTTFTHELLTEPI